MSIKKAQENWEDFMLLEELEKVNLTEEQVDQWTAKAKEYYGAVGASKMSTIVNSSGEERQDAIRDLMANQKQFLKQWIKSTKQGNQQQATDGKQPNTKELIQKLEQETEENEQMAQKAEQAVEQAKSDDVIEKIKQKETEYYKKQAEQFGKMMAMHFQTLKMAGFSDEQIKNASKEALNRLNPKEPWSNYMAVAIVNARKKIAP